MQEEKRDYRYLSKIFHGHNRTCLASFNGRRRQRRRRKVRSHISVFRRQFYVQLVHDTLTPGAPGSKFHKGRSRTRSRAFTIRGAAKRRPPKFSLESMGNFDNIPVCAIISLEWKRDLANDINLAMCIL